MKLLIDGSGGFAGDMFTAALIDAGADFELVADAMRKSGEKLGRIHIDIEKTRDGSTRLLLSLSTDKTHVNTNEIRELLKESYGVLKTPEIFKKFGFRVLNILEDAEKKAHKQNIFKELRHHRGTEKKGTFLHEAQDILIDIIGAVTGMKLLNIYPEASLITQVSTGKGKVKFSHGILDVPAPATGIILDEYKIGWIKGSVENELCTPTGASILAGLIKDNKILKIDEKIIIKSGYSRGSKTLPIPPLGIHLI